MSYEMYTGDVAVKYVLIGIVSYDWFCFRSTVTSDKPRREHAFIPLKTKINLNFTGQ
jgi:hypothetical protein